MALVTSYDQAKIDDLLADLQAWATANLAPITEPQAVNAQAAADAAQADVDSLDTQVVKLSGNQAVAGQKTFTDVFRVANDDVQLGVGAAGAGPYLNVGSLGSPDSTWVDARSSDANCDLRLRAKGTGRVRTNSRLYLENGLQVLQTNVGTSTYTATLNDEIIAVGTTCTVTLPNNAAGLYAGKRYTIANTGSGIVSLSGVPLVGVSATIPAGNSITLWSDGTNYYQEGVNGEIICTSSTKPTVNLYAGLRIFETDKLRSCVYSGSAWYVSDHCGWTAWTPVFTGLTSPAGVFKYNFTANRLEIMGYFSAGSCSAAGQPTMTIPSGLTLTTAGVQRQQYFTGPPVNLIAILTGNTNSITLNLTAGPNGANFANGDSVASARITGCVFEVQETYF